MDTFDADVLIYAAASGHDLGRRVAPCSRRTPSEARSPQPGSGRSSSSPSCCRGRCGIATRPSSTSSARCSAASSCSRRRWPWRNWPPSSPRGTACRTANAVHARHRCGRGSRPVHHEQPEGLPASIDEIDIVYPSELPEQRRTRDHLVASSRSTQRNGRVPRRARGADAQVARFGRLLEYTYAATPSLRAASSSSSYVGFAPSTIDGTSRTSPTAWRKPLVVISGTGTVPALDVRVQSVSCRVIWSDVAIRRRRDRSRHGQVDEILSTM